MLFLNQLDASAVSIVAAFLSLTLQTHCRALSDVTLYMLVTGEEGVKQKAARRLSLEARLMRNAGQLWLQKGRAVLLLSGSNGCQVPVGSALTAVLQWEGYF